MASAKRKFIVPFLVIVMLFVAGCAKKDVKEAEKVYVPDVLALEVQPGLEQEFTVTGDVLAHQISRITAEQRGKVESILVKEGDTVSKGQNLITLSSSQINSAFNTASSVLGNARVGLEQTALSSEKSIQASEIALETAEINLQNTLSQNEALHKQAQEILEAAKLNSDLSIASAETSLNNAIKNALLPAQSAFNTCNRFLGVSEAYEFSNDVFLQDIGALNSSVKQDTKTSLKNLKSLLDSYSESYEEALGLLVVAEDSVQKTLSTLSYSRTGTRYPRTQLTADISIVTPELSAVRAAISSLESAKQALELAQQESNGISQSVLTAEAVYQATMTQLEANEKSGRQAIESAENALENAKRSADLSRVSAKSSVDSAYGNFDQARISKDKLTIQAPFQGKVSAIQIKTGGEVNPGTPLITVEDDSQLNLVAYLSSSDVKKVNIGDVVMINQTDLSEITSIAPSADSLTKKYKVEIDYTDSSLRPGELVKLTFITGEKVFDGGRIFVPLPALHILPGEIFVWTLENRKTVKTPINVGEIVGDYVEVLSGLEIGDDIITEGGRLIEDEGTKVRALNRPTPKMPSS